MGILAGVIALVLAWALVGQVRKGEVLVRSAGRSRKRISRAENPLLFWVLTAVYSAVILYIASFAFTA
jgi:hypothetical protein